MIEPDEIAREIVDAIMPWGRVRQRVHEDADALVAAAIRAAVEACAQRCEAMIVGGRMWTEEQATAADALLAAAKGIRALVAPASERTRRGMGTDDDQRRDDGSTLHEASAAPLPPLEREGEVRDG